MRGIGPVQVVDGLSVNLSQATSSDHSAPLNPLGAVVQLDDGRKYRYLKNSQASVIGQIVVPLLSIDDADVDAAASDNTLTGTGDFTADQFNDGHSFVWINANTGIGQYRRILSNTANVLTLDRAWTTALATDSDYVTFGVYYVELADAALEMVVGVALGANTADYYNWYAIGGLCGVRAAGGTDALVAHEPLVSSSAEGVAKGLSGSPTAEEVGRSFGYAVMAVSAADSAGQLVPVMCREL